MELVRNLLLGYILTQRTVKILYTNTNAENQQEDELHFCKFNMLLTR